MGLDVSHDCWSGPYSAFTRYRAGLVRLAWGPDEKAGNLFNYEGFHGYRDSEQTSPVALPWPKDDPLVTLINHSDCDGEIEPEECGPLADRLEQLLDKMPQRALYDTLRPATERWIKGLREAAAAGESVEFS